MKEYFDIVKKKMEAEKGKFNGSYDNAYWLGFIHGLRTAGFLSEDESNELINDKRVLFCPYLFTGKGKEVRTCQQVET